MNDTALAEANARLDELEKQLLLTQVKVNAVIEVLDTALRAQGELLACVERMNRKLDATEAPASMTASIQRINEWIRTQEGEL